MKHYKSISYHLLSELSLILEREATLSSFSAKGDAFQLEAVGEAPFRLMERFAGHPRFSQVKITQVLPAAGTAQRFSLIGIYHDR